MGPINGGNSQPDGGSSQGRLQMNTEWQLTYGWNYCGCVLEPFPSAVIWLMFVGLQKRGQRAHLAPVSEMSQPPLACCWYEWCVQRGKRGLFWKVGSLELLGNTLDVLEIKFWERLKPKSFRDDITQAHISHHALQGSSHAAILSQSFRQHHATNRSELDVDRKSRVPGDKSSTRCCWGFVP